MEVHPALSTPRGSQTDGCNRIPLKKHSMKIQVNTDKHIEGREALVAHVEATVSSALERFHTRITRVEVHLSDENGAKDGQYDKRCMMEVRIAGRQPMAVTCEAASVDQAINGAADRLKSSLASTLDQLDEHRHRS